MSDALQQLLAEVDAMCTYAPEQIEANLADLQRRYDELTAAEHARLEARFWEVMGDVRP